MQTTEKKRKWAKPKLIVLVRREPEERVLQICKSGITEGQEHHLADCFNGEWPCYEVSEIALS
jgi:hypothetical protein